MIFGAMWKIPRKMIRDSLPFSFKSLSRSSTMVTHGELSILLMFGQEAKVNGGRGPRGQSVFGRMDPSEAKMVEGPFGVLIDHSHERLRGWFHTHSGVNLAEATLLANDLEAYIFQQLKSR